MEHAGRRAIIGTTITAAALGTTITAAALGTGGLITTCAATQRGY